MARKRRDSRYLVVASDDRPTVYRSRKKALRHARDAAGEGQNSKVEMHSPGGVAVIYQANGERLLVAPSAPMTLEGTAATAATERLQRLLDVWASGSFG